MLAACLVSVACVVLLCKSRSQAIDFRIRICVVSPSPPKIVSRPTASWSTMSRDSQESGSNSAEEYSEEDASSDREEESSRESDEESEEEPDEPVLKYKRFAKDVVFGISEGPGSHKNIICCIAVHPKVNDRWSNEPLARLCDYR